jgi:hypothetical protein
VRSVEKEPTLTQKGGGGWRGRTVCNFLLRNYISEYYTRRVREGLSDIHITNRLRVNIDVGTVSLPDSTLLFVNATSLICFFHSSYSFRAPSNKYKDLRRERRL